MVSLQIKKLERQKQQETPFSSIRIGFQKMLAKKLIQKKNILQKFFSLYILNLFFVEESSTQKTSANKRMHMNTPSDLPRTKN
jgi:hypothetical protein